MDYFDLARLNMVRNQIMPIGVTNESLLQAFSVVCKHQFVPTKWEAIAYSDAKIQIDDERFMLSSQVLAKMIQALRPRGVVLDVGCGLGYSTAILSKLSDYVIGVEGNMDLASQASANIKNAGIENYDIVVSNVLGGVASAAPFDSILIQVPLKNLPEQLTGQLRNGGRLLYLKQAGVSALHAMLVQNLGHSIDETYVFDVL